MVWGGVCGVVFFGGGGRRLYLKLFYFVNSVFWLKMKIIFFTLDVKFCCDRIQGVVIYSNVQCIW